MIALLADRQHGVVARHHLIESGMGRRAIEERLARGRLHPVHRGVYAVGHRRLTRRGRWMAAVLAGGHDACLSHRAAGQLWQLLSWQTAHTEVTRPRSFRPRDGIVAHRGLVPADERTTVDGIPVTSVPRTILDLAAMLQRRQLERALKEVEVLGLTDPLSVPDLLARHPGRRGAATLRAVLGDWSADRGVTANDFEDAFSGLVLSHGLTLPRFNADICVRGRVYKVDAVWERERVIVELDGRAAHTTAAAFESDRERDRRMLLDGWQIVRITWLQLRDEPEVIARDLRELLSRYAASTLKT